MVEVIRWIIIIILIIFAIVGAVVRVVRANWLRALWQGKTSREFLTGKSEEEMYYEKHGVSSDEERKKARVFKDEEK
jgi:hypothetical protein